MREKGSLYVLFFFYQGGKIFSGILPLCLQARAKNLEKGHILLFLTWGRLEVGERGDRDLGTGC